MKSKKIQNTLHRKNSEKYVKIIISRYYPLLVICILGIVIYSNSLNSTFHLDDFHSIVNNTTLRDIHNIHAIWNNYLHGKFRFIGFLSFALNYYVHQHNVFGYHAVNLFIHLCASVCVWWMVLLILNTPVMQREAISKHKKYIASWCALLFVSHPIQTQAVTYIVQRFASLSTLFYLASLCFYLQGRLTAKKLTSALFFTMSALTAILGLFTKETIFTLPLAIMLFEFSFFHPGGLKSVIKNKKILLSFLPLLLFALLIPALLYVSYKSLHLIFNRVISNRSQDPLITCSIYLMTQFRVIVTYIRLLFLPINQNVDYDFPVSLSFFEISTFSSFLFLLLLVVLAFWLFPRKRLESVGILWFFLTLSVESSFKPLRNVIFEHRLYLPMFGFSLFFVSALYDIAWAKQRKAVVILFLAVIGCFSVLTYERNRIWKNEISLWSDAVKKSPEKSRPHLNLGGAYFKNGDMEKGYQEFLATLKISPNDYLAINNIGYYLFTKGKYKEAIEHYEKALSLSNFEGTFLNRAVIYANLADALAKEEKYDEALPNYRTAISEKTEYLEKLRLQANDLAQKSKLEIALPYYMAILDYRPDDFDAHKKIGQVQFQLGHFEESVKQFSRALEIKPDNAELHNFIGMALFNMRNTDEAVKHYREAIHINPEYFDAHMNLTICLQAQGKLEEAEKELNRTNELYKKLQQSRNNTKQ